LPGDDVTIVTSQYKAVVMKTEWVLLVYKIPSQPTRLRAQIWRALQRCGAVYLQDSVSIVPATSELAENMQWIADEIRELGGEAHLFRATATGPAQDERIEGRFLTAGRQEAEKITGQLRELEQRLKAGLPPERYSEMEDDLRRLRQAALKLRARSHFPVTQEEALHDRLRSVRDRLDRLTLRASRKGRRP
jgi:hypothetical protein